MTRLILSTLFLVGIAGSAGAAHLLPLTQTLECGPQNHFCGQTLGHDDVVDTDTFVFMSSKDVACLAKMEAAMQAMEPFIEDGYIGRHLNGVDRLHGELWPNGAWEAWNQWATVKQECWTMP